VVEMDKVPAEFEYAYNNLRGDRKWVPLVELQSFLASRDEA
jgi:hypothetical protein